MFKQFMVKLLEGDVMEAFGKKDDGAPTPGQGSAPASGGAAPASGNGVDAAAADAPAPGNSGDVAEPSVGHDDAQEDLLMLQKIISQALGEEHMDNPEAQTMAKDAVGSYLEMGYEKLAAQEAATHSMKLAKHMGEKKSKEAAPAPEATPTQEAAAPVVTEECSTPTKESDGIKAQVPALTKKGSDATPVDALKEAMERIAVLENKLLESDVAAKVDHLLRESNLAGERANFLKLVDGEKDLTKITEKFTAFRDSVKSAGASNNGLSFAMLEKASVPAQGGTTGGFSNFV